MPKATDTRFDIDAKFQHLVKLGEDLSKPREWHFSLRSKKSELPKLTKLGESLLKDFEVHLQEEVETWVGEKKTMGPPLLSIVRTAVLTPAEVKKLAKKFETLAKKHGFTYDGVSSYEAVDFDELFGWLELDDAIWRLRHFTDTGLAEGDPTPFMFALTARKAAALKTTAEAVKKWRGVQTDISESDDGPLLQILGPGKNDEAALRKRYKQVEELAKTTKVQLLGMQFFDRFNEDAAEAEENESEKAPPKKRR
jgi:hypothetical protein